MAGWWACAHFYSFWQQILQLILPGPRSFLKLSPYDERTQNFSFSHILANVLSRSAIKSSSSFVSPSLAFRGVMAGESRAGVESVGEFSFSSLKLKLFLYNESALSESLKPLLSLTLALLRRFMRCRCSS